MSALGEDVRDAVLAVLPGLQEEKLLSLLNKLASIGVKSKSDLQLVKEEDLSDHITPMQCRRLLNAWNVEGEIPTATQWILSFEGQVVMNPHPNFMAGFAALFATYYNFNLVYQHEASCTLEFVQRCFDGINPSTGT